MNILTKTLLFIAAAIGLSGCLYGQCIDGPCALERAKIIQNIKPYGAHWVKAGMTNDERTNDWVICGGDISGSFSPSIKTLADGEKVGVSREETRRQLETQADACMVTRGYRFIRD